MLDYMIVAVQAGHTDLERRQTRLAMSDYLRSSFPADTTLAYIPAHGKMIDQIEYVGMVTSPMIPEFKLRGVQSVDYTLNTLMSQASQALVFLGGAGPTDQDIQFMSYAVFHGVPITKKMIHYSRQDKEMIKFTTAKSLIETSDRLDLTGFFVSDLEGIFLGQLNKGDSGWEIGEKYPDDLLYPVNVSSTPL